jgi:hypothetical protein
MFKSPFFNPKKQVLRRLLKDEDVAADDHMATLDIHLRELSIGKVIEKPCNSGQPRE